MGAFCAVLGFKPWDYWRLTGAERDAIVAAWNKANKKGG